eukprot:2443466-Prymnesium_polylepis.1
MDPQQRLLLELSYSSLHAATLNRAALLDSDASVFIGMDRPDWALMRALLREPSTSAYAVSSDTASIAAGRISFVLGLRGACLTVDTACSSTLVAFGAAATMGFHEPSETALVAAVSLKLLVNNTLAAAAAGMLSVDGRCKTYDALANGY